MRFALLVPSDHALEELSSAMALARWPRLELVASLPLAETASRAPRHLAPRLTPASEVTHLDAAFSPEQAVPLQVRRGLPIVNLQGLADLYERWRLRVLRPHVARVGWRTPDLLIDRRACTPQRFDLVGTCHSFFIADAAHSHPEHLLGPLTVRHLTKNSVAPVAIPPGECDAVLVSPPFRFLNGGYLDAELTMLDPGSFADTVAGHLRGYLDSVRAQWPSQPMLVTNFLPSSIDPAGLFPRVGGLNALVAGASSVVEHWVAQHKGCWLIDLATIASGIGLAGTEDGAFSIFAHRGMLDATDDWIDNRQPNDLDTLVRHVEMLRDELGLAVMREAQAILMAIRGEQQVKAVVTDLDGTLWRGEAVDEGVQQRWVARYAGYAEALVLLRRRGLLLGVISKNDPSFITKRWPSLVDDGTDERLRVPLALEDFDAVEISLEEKPRAMERVLATLGVLPASVVFIDDSPYEREAMLRAFPEMRVLGAEPQYLRRELLMSPATQRPFDDSLKEARHHSVAVRRLAEASPGGATELLADLGLEASISVTTGKHHGPESRELQLLNKTNQWSLNGKRLEAISPAAIVASIRLRDRIADHGHVGVAVLDPRTRTVTHMAISCRVLGMGVDLALASFLVERLGARSFAHAPTDRNTAAQGFAALHLQAATAPWVDVPSHLVVHAPDEDSLAATLGHPCRSRCAADPLPASL